MKYHVAGPRRHDQSRQRHANVSGQLPTHRRDESLPLRLLGRAHRSAQLLVLARDSHAAQMRNAPFRPALEKMAHTLVYESMILGSLPAGLVASIRVPTLVIDGEESPEVMRHAAQSLAGALPDGRYRTLDGQGHDIVPAVVAPVLEEFFLAQSPSNQA